MRTSFRFAALTLALVAGSAGAQGRFDPDDLARLADALLRAGRTPEDVREALRQERDAGDEGASKERFEELLKRLTDRPKLQEPAEGQGSPEDGQDEDGEGGREPEPGDGQDGPGRDRDSQPERVKRPEGMLGELTGLSGTGSLLSPGERPERTGGRDEDGDRDSDPDKDRGNGDRDTAGNGDRDSESPGPGEGAKDKGRDGKDRPPADLVSRYAQELRDLEDSFSMASALNAGSTEDLEPVLGFLEGLDPAGLLSYSTYVDQAIVRLGALAIQEMGNPNPAVGRRWRKRADALRRARTEARQAQAEALAEMAAAQRTRRGRGEKMEAAREKLAELRVKDPAALRRRAAQAVRSQQKMREGRRDVAREERAESIRKLREGQQRSWKEALERIRKARERRPDGPAEEPEDVPDVDEPSDDQPPADSPSPGDDGDPETQAPSGPTPPDDGAEAPDEDGAPADEPEETEEEGAPADEEDPEAPVSDEANESEDTEDSEEPGEPGDEDSEDERESESESEEDSEESRTN